LLGSSSGRRQVRGGISLRKRGGRAVSLIGTGRWGLQVKIFGEIMWSGSLRLVDLELLRKLLFVRLLDLSLELARTVFRTWLLQGMDCRLGLLFSGENVAWWRTDRVDLSGRGRWGWVMLEWLSRRLLYLLCKVVYEVALLLQLGLLLRGQKDLLGTTVGSVLNMLN